MLTAQKHLHIRNHRNNKDQMKKYSHQTFPAFKHMSDKLTTDFHMMQVLTISKQQ